MPIAIDSVLPSSGLGFVCYKNKTTRYGTASTIAFIQRLAARWAFTHVNGPRPQIGDISTKGGGPCPNGGKDNQGNRTFHKSHQEGRDFDIQIIRPDGKEGVRTVRISDRTTHPPTQQLVDLLHEDRFRPSVQLILTAGKTSLRGSLLRYERDHTYHLHVRLRS